ncbi:MAG: glycosyltransferase family 9 protein [Bacteroidetes bacterium]|nr:glycosyltransferase family 9 protein [Bacteroidota bacterium]MBS1648688.1 glycosyltransferase family 9 protein [Bacteroidota bacterium]
MQKILIIQTAFIGDAVLATGLIEKIYSFYPTAQIDFLVRKGNEALFANHPVLHKVLSWNKKQNKYKHLLQLLKQIRNTKYDKVINVQRYAATGFITAFSNAKETIGFDKNPFSFLFTKKIKHVVSDGSHSLHEIERNHTLIQSFTDNVAAKPKLYPSVEDEAAVSIYKNKLYVCVAPASVWFTKQFPKEKWIEFINQIPNWFTIYLLGAPNDNDLCKQIITSSTHSNIINLSGKLTYLQSAALMQTAVMNFVNDSAPMHFASSVNAPVTAVYCSTIPAFGFGPLSTKSFIIETTENLLCRPCGLHGYKSCPQGHFKCALSIKTEQLLATVNS